MRVGGIGTRAGSPIEGRGDGSGAKFGCNGGSKGDTVGPGLLERLISVSATSQGAEMGGRESVRTGVGELSGGGGAIIKIGAPAGGGGLKSGGP